MGNVKKCKDVFIGFCSVDNVSYLYILWIPSDILPYFPFVFYPVSGETSFMCHIYYSSIVLSCNLATGM